MVKYFYVSLKEVWCLYVPILFHVRIYRVFALLHAQIFCDLLWSLERKDGGLKKYGNTNIILGNLEHATIKQQLQRQRGAVKYKFFKFGLSRSKMGGEWVLQRETFLQTLEIQKVVKGEKMLILWPDGNQLAYYSYLELFVLVCFQFKKGL